MKKLFTLMIAGCLSVGLLTGCAQTTKPWQPQVNLIVKNHKAADKLIDGLGAGFDRSTPIVITTISDIDKLETSSALGRSISEQILSKMVEEGFENISEIRLRRALFLRQRDKAASGEFLLSRDARAISGLSEAGAVVTGTYAVSSGEVQVSVRIIDVASGKVLSAHDYMIPVNDNIQDMLNTDEGIGSNNTFFSYNEKLDTY
tara:strand:- start:1044 stop:1652 length:609 start_codon:yes stop_codon:yes gene_type:complete